MTVLRQIPAGCLALAFCWMLPAPLKASEPDAYKRLKTLERAAPASGDSESLKTAGDKAWDLLEDRGTVVGVGVSAKIITPATNGKPWGEPFVPSHPSGHYVLGDKCLGSSHNGACDELFFGGFKSFEDPKKNWWRWLFRGVRRDPRFYNTPDGVHDDLYARALILKAAGKKIGIVTVDVVGLLYPDTERIREQVKDLDFDLVIVQATHNHEAPDTIGLWGPFKTPGLVGFALDRLLGKNPLHAIDGKNPRFMSQIYRQAAAALREADRDSQEANLYLGSAPVPDFNGKSIIADWRDPQVYDKDVHTIQARNIAGQPIATLANFGIHPELFWYRITRMSADISGRIAGALEEMGGGLGFHSNAAIGAQISPNDLYGHGIDAPGEKRLKLSKELELRWEGIKTIGRLVSETAMQSVQSAKPAKISRVGIVKRKVFIPMDNKLFDDLARANVFQRTRYTNGVEDPDGQDLMTEMDLIVLHGPDDKPLAEIFTIPGELAPEIYMGGFLKPGEAANPQAPETPVIKNYLRAPHQYLLGLGNDELGYIIPLNDWLFPKGSLRLFGQTDKFGRNHSQETKSAGSQMSQIIPLTLIGMLQEYYDGRTDLTQEAISRKARSAALQTFANQPEAIPALIDLYLHEPIDEVTGPAGAALVKMGRRGRLNDVRDFLDKALSGTKNPERRGMLSDLLNQLPDPLRRDDFRFR